jgi:Flp pilus assembly protein TadG
MSASISKSICTKFRRFVPLRRFARRQDGAAAIEFGFVAMPFLLLMFLIMETGLLFFAGQTLETAVADSARMIKTGQAQNFDEDAFKAEVCKHIFALFDCAQISVDVRNPSAFSSIDRSVQLDGTGKPITQYSTSALGSGQIAVVRLIYSWPILFPLTQRFLGDGGSSKHMLVATAAFKNEPF